MENTQSTGINDTKKKILVIEDDNTISNMYKIGLTNDGYEVVIAKDGQEGLELSASEKPDIILLDIIMPKIDGFAVLGRLKENPVTKEIPVFLLTNLGQDEDKERGKKLGAVDYVVKADLTPMQISEKIKTYLNK